MKHHPTPPSVTATLLFHAERLSLALDCISLIRRLGGRMLGHGMIPPPHIRDGMVELRDLLEELCGDNAATPPLAKTIKQVRRMDDLLQSTPLPGDVFEGIPLSGTQKIILGDMVLYLGKAHELLYDLSETPVPLEPTRQFFHTALGGTILLLTNVFDPEMFDSYDLQEMIEGLTRSLPVPMRTADAGPGVAEKAPPAPGPGTPPPASDLISDAIAKALAQEDEEWKLGDDGLVKIPEPKASDEDDLVTALKREMLGDAAWDEIWIDDATEGADANSAGYSEEIQAIHSNEVQGLFTSIAKQFCTPLPSLLTNIQNNDISAEVLEGVYGIVLNIFNSAEQFGYGDLRENLGRIRRILERCACDPQRLTARERVEILAEYDHLAVSFPEIFEAIGKQERGQRLRESIIIMEELRAIKGMGTRRITRLFAAGISNLRSFVEARLEDFSAVSSIDSELAARILTAFRPYEVLVAPFVGEEILNSFYREQRAHLCEETERLREAHNLYAEESRKSKSREQRAKLRDLHRKRETAMGRIRCGLAVLDEFDLIEGMRRIRYDKRLEMLDEWLARYSLES